MNQQISTNAMPELESDGLPSTQRGPLTSRQRWVSLAEFLLGAAIVIAYNVFHVIPNEVPILFVLGMVSLRLRDGGWSAMGLRWPVALRNTVLVALAAAATRILLGALVVDPLTARFWPAAAGPSGFDAIAGHPWIALRWLGIVWTFAAFGEEISYRGYLLTRASDVGGRSKLADWIGVLLVSILFGVGHYYKGAAGMVDSGMAGFVLGAAFLLSGRNLWVCILAHGFIDSFGVIALYFGWSS
jgi:membrane protease YdiL (CAAX protease family)